MSRKIILYSLGGILFLVAMFLISIYIHKVELDGVWFVKDANYKIYNDTIPYFGELITFKDNGVATFPTQKGVLNFGDSVIWNIEKSSLGIYGETGILNLSSEADSLYNGQFEYKIYSEENLPYLKITSKNLELELIKAELSLSKPVRYIPNLSIGKSINQKHNKE